MDNYIIRQIKLNKSNNQLSVTIPRDSIFEAYDYVVIQKLEVKVEEVENGG